MDEGKWGVMACSSLRKCSTSYGINGGAGAWLIGFEWIYDSDS